MYGLVEALEDGRRVSLLFIDKEQAESFVRFMHIYITDSGAGNGCRAYWYSRNNPVVGVDVKMGQGTLNGALIESMVLSICDARAACAPVREEDAIRAPEYTPAIGREDGAITFIFDPEKLPPRIQPGVGDLARIVDDPDYDRCIARVQEIRWATAVVAHCPYSCLFENEEVELPLTYLMKIYDIFPGE